MVVTACVIHYMKQTHWRRSKVVPHCRHDTICIPIQLPQYDTRYDTLHNNKTRRVLPCVLLVGSADKPSLEYNAKHCISLFGKSPCIRTKKQEGEH